LGRTVRGANCPGTNRPGMKRTHTKHLTFLYHTVGESQ